MVPSPHVQRSLGASPTLSTVTRQGRALTLRTPRFSDAEDWRRVRLANQELIEPFWDHSTLSWSERHTRRVWLRECVSARRRMRRGAGLHTVIDVDRQLAGQCDVWIDRYHGRSELGLWVAAGHSNAGVGSAAVRLVVGHLFDAMSIERVAAPIACGNDATIRIARRLGFVREGVMRSYMTVGSRRRDHELWSLTRNDWLGASATRDLR
ncbi:GNAT family N-acetyltransferase [Mycobacterium sp. 21AC1]|uniref:GNAT family N-acetyltransferase n=1 Tax=[Mycobacterium] appelbergii TaxID=2939269 RepID=UPI002938F78B|nr:GNAT family protein [Mycobacterium sp. 21AC1]MDV3125584.1 GNAT family N-acetyltransferase [Mycobacterium sp. 21AC1]